MLLLGSWRLKSINIAPAKSEQIKALLTFIKHGRDYWNCWTPQFDAKSHSSPAWHKSKTADFPSFVIIQICQTFLIRQLSLTIVPWAQVVVLKDHSYILFSVILKNKYWKDSTWLGYEIICFLTKVLIEDNFIIVFIIYLWS